MTMVVLRVKIIVSFKIYLIKMKFFIKITITVECI
uniref:Uncharacterized protein n=1 Tax=Anguilla anguilla TaxID=7936 RepID=A0A0E9RSV6_ANGAN